jgi:ferredoxin
MEPRSPKLESIWFSHLLTHNFEYRRTDTYLCHSVGLCVRICPVHQDHRLSGCPELAGLSPSGAQMERYNPKRSIEVCIQPTCFGAF